MLFKKQTNKFNKETKKMSIMTKFKIISAATSIVVVIIMFFVFYQLVSVNADEEGVFVKKPYIFGRGGVSNTPLQNGSEWKVFSTSFVKFKVVPIQYDEDFDDIMTNDNVPIDLTCHALIQIEKGKTPVLLKNFGEQWYKNDIQKIYTNEVRNEISKYRMYDLTSNREVYDSISKVVEEVINNKIIHEKIPVKLLKVTVDRARPNADVLAEYNRTATQLQAIQTQKAMSAMQDERKIAEAKRAEADDAYRNKMGLSPQQFIQLRGLEIEKEKIEMVKSKGDKVSITMLMGGNAMPIYNVNH